MSHMNNPSKTSNGEHMSEPNQSTLETVLAAIKEFDALGQSATRHSIQAITGLKLSIVDDRLKALRDDDLIHRNAKGSYEVIKTYPAPRAMSKTLVDGWVMYEVGDVVLKLTPAENRQMSEMCAGTSVQVEVLESVRQHQFLARGLVEKVDQLSMQVKDLKEINKARESELRALKQA